LQCDVPVPPELALNGDVLSRLRVLGHQIHAQVGPSLSAGIVLPEPHLVEAHLRISFERSLNQALEAVALILLASLICRLALSGLKRGGQDGIEIGPLPHWAVEARR